VQSAFENQAKRTIRNDALTMGVYLSVTVTAFPKVDMGPSRRIKAHFNGNLPRISLALACAIMFCAPCPTAIAQESGLRGTVKETGPELVDPLNKKKKKKVSKLDAAQAAAQEPMARYEPADLDPNANPDDQAQTGSDQPVASSVEDSAPAKPIAATTASNGGQPDTLTAQNASSDALDTQTTGTALREDDVPVPFSPVQSDGALERDETARAKKDNLKEAPIEGLDKTGETDPYAAPGIVAGSFTLRPTLEQGLRWTNNSDASATGGEAFISETNVKLRAESNWLRHRLNLEATGGFRKSVSGEDLSEPTMGLSADLQLDVSTATQINAKASWDRSIESASAPALMTGPFTRPVLDTLRASLGATYDPGLFGATATAQVTRQAYGDATNSLGVDVPQDDRNNTFASLTLRGSYDLSPVLTPFIEVEAGRRFYDKSLDSYGKARSAYRYGARAGIAANLGEKLSGEFAAGWLKEDIDDATLSDVSGLDIRGTMNWSPQRGTNVALSLATTVEGSTIAASSGSVLYSTDAKLTHSLRDNLEANLALGAGWRIYERGAYQDTIFSGEAGLTWWMNRYAGLNGRVRHEQVLNADAARAYGATSVYLGVTLRR
jgi:hypothetical protein